MTGHHPGVPGLSKNKRRSFISSFFLRKNERIATNPDSKSKWLSKEETTQQADIPIKPKEHVEFEHDTEFKQIFEGLFSAPSFGAMPGLQLLQMGPSGMPLFPRTHTY
jgi:hypothetical protein